jgi:hypothetical protein
MQKHRRLIGLRLLLREDLDAVCADLTGKFDALSGRTAADCWGNYLVQSVLHGNETQNETRAAGDKIDLAVYDD